MRKLTLCEVANTPLRGMAPSSDLSSGTVASASRLTPSKVGPLSEFSTNAAAFVTGLTDTGPIYEPFQPSNLSPMDEFEVVQVMGRHGGDRLPFG
jgi:hypothetical protein